LAGRKCDRALLIFAVVLFLSGCQRATESSSHLSIKFAFAPQPPQVGPVTIKMVLMDNAQPVTGARILLEADMPHPGMSPVFGNATEIDSGFYQGRLDLKMAGDWVVLAHVKLVNGPALEYQTDLQGVRPTR